MVLSKEARARRAETAEDRELDELLTHKERPAAAYGTIALSYLLAAGLLITLVWAGGLWNQLANTRLLDLLVRGGLVALTDADAGLIHGVPNAEYYLASQDPVDLSLLIFGASALFLLAWILRAIQFHGIVSFVGAGGSLRDRIRAYLYGGGMDRLLPFNLGMTATATGLQGQGTPLADATQAVWIARVFTIFEIVVLTVTGLIIKGWTTFLGEIFWGFLVLAAAWLVVRNKGGRAHGVGVFTWFKQSLAALAQRPGVLVRLGLFSLVAVLLEPVAGYVITQAFTSPNIILNVDFGTLALAIAAGSIARLIPVTPGGVGQFEWAFAAALYVGGVGMPEAVTIAILFSFVRYLIDFVVLGRYIVGTLILGSSVTFGFEVSSSLRNVLGTGSRSGPDTGATAEVAR